MFSEAVNVALITSTIGGSFYLAQPILFDMYKEWMEEKNHNKSG